MNHEEHEIKQMVVNKPRFFTKTQHFSIFIKKKSSTNEG